MVCAVNGIHLPRISISPSCVFRILFGEPTSTGIALSSQRRTFWGNVNRSIVIDILVSEIQAKMIKYTIIFRFVDFKSNIENSPVIRSIILSGGPPGEQMTQFYP
jgi:hypothetical protein